MFVKHDGVWKAPRKIYTKDGGVWKSIKSIYVRSSGTWVEDMLVPSNVVLLYTSMPTTGYVCDGTNGTPNLIDKALAISDTPLQVGGNNTHNGTDHGTITIAVGAVTAAVPYTPNWHVSSPMADFSSSPDSFVHSHSGTATTSSSGACDLRLPGKSLIPIIGQLVVEPNCLFLRANTVSSSYLAYLADYVAKYLYLARTSAEIAYTNTTTHANASITTGAFRAVPNPRFTDTTSWAYLDTHSHQVQINVDHNSPVPLTKTYIPYRTTQMMSWRDVPSGSLIFVTDNNLPSGYSWVSFSNPTLVKANSSSGSVVGSITHTHSTATALAGSESWSGSYLLQGGSASGAYYTLNRSHSYAHHPYLATMSAANTMPAYVTLRLAVKN